MRSFFKLVVVAFSVILTGCVTPPVRFGAETVKAVAGAGAAKIRCELIHGNDCREAAINGAIGSVINSLFDDPREGSVTTVGRAPAGVVMQPQTNQQNSPCPQGRHTGWEGNRPVCELPPMVQQAPQAQHVANQSIGISQVGTPACYCVRSDWGKACGDDAFREAEARARAGKPIVCTRP
jgi:hypothetical protein